MSAELNQYSIFTNLVKDIPYEHVSFDVNLLNELKAINVVKINRNCVHKLRINNKLEVILRDRIKRDIKEAFFQYGQILFLQARYIDALFYFNKGAADHKDLQCMFQMGIIYYDGLDIQSDSALGCSYMKIILKNKNKPEAKHLQYPAAFNLGRAYYMGYGVTQSNEKALFWWLFSADGGSPLGSVHAQSMLGYYYSSSGHVDLEKAFFWHSEACGNGSLQSQAVLGVMYFLGIGKSVNLESGLTCLRSAASRGNIYARGMICYFYYSRHLYTMAANLASQMINSAPFIDADDSDSFRKGFAIAYFIYGRCLNFGLGVKKNHCLSQILNKKSYAWDVDITLHFRRLVGLGLM